MANIPAIAADGITLVYLKSNGIGTDLDPFLPGQVLTDEIGNSFTAISVGTTNALSVAVVDGAGDQVTNFGSSSGLTDTELRASPIDVGIVSSPLPSVTTATILSATTNVIGTDYVAFPGEVCGALDLINNTGTTIEYRRGGAGVAMQIPDKSARLVLGITDSNQISIRRTDTDNTQVTVHAEAFVL